MTFIYFFAIFHYKICKNKQTQMRVNITKHIFQNKGFGKIPSARLDSHQNSVNNGPDESFPALTATILVNFLKYQTHILKNCRPENKHKSN